MAIQLDFVAASKNSSFLVGLTISFWSLLNNIEHLCLKYKTALPDDIDLAVKK